MKMTVIVFSATLALLGALLRPAPATACSWLAKPIAGSLPLTGARDVPIDVAPVIRGHGAPQLLRWEAQDGTPVAFDIREGPSASFTEGKSLELVPRNLLRPNTTYTVRARIGDATSQGSEESIVFTTGTMIADDAPAADPPLAATVLTIPPSMCTSDTYASCIFGGPDSVLLEISDASGKQLVRDVVTADALVYVTDPHCIRVSARSASGRLSGVSELCGDALKIRAAKSELDGTHPCRNGGFLPARAATLEEDEPEADDEETMSSQEAITTSGAARPDPVQTPSDDGCALARGRGPAANGSLLVILLMGWLLRAQRRRASRASRLPTSRLC